MLHSDQSFPGIPEQTGSTVGTDPEKKDTDNKTQQAHLFYPFCSVSYLCLHHGRPLCSEGLDSLEEVDHALEPHPL